RPGTPFRKLCIAIAFKLAAADGVQDPLPYVPAEVEDEIAGTIGVLVGSPPKILLGHLFKAMLHFWQEVVFEKYSRCFDEFLPFGRCFATSRQHGFLISKRVWLFALARI